MRAEGNGGQSHQPVIVGYDGSRNAGAALGWAYRAAEHWSSPLHVVYVFEWSTPTGPVPAAASWPDRSARRETEAAVAEAVARVRGWQPRVPVVGKVVDGSVVSTLRRLSQQARLLVVGDRGLGGFPGLRTGSVATDLASCALSPAVIVRGTAPARQPVVVGVDDSPDSEEALRFAFEQAGARGVGLRAVRACGPPPVPRRYDAPLPAYHDTEHRAGQRRLVERVLERWLEKYPDVRVSIDLLADRPADALITASRQAQLVVVGARGQRGPQQVQPLGPATGHLIQHAYCPVAVLRQPPALAPALSLHGIARAGIGYVGLNF